MLLQSVKKVLEELDIEYPDFNVCSSSSQSFSLLRAQMKATFNYCQNEGPKVISAKHDDKCLNTIRLAKTNNVDLLVFPEYCVSYEVIQALSDDIDIWPRPKKLWCIPCQGIKYSDFESKMKSFENEKVKVINNAYREENHDAKDFVNALIYCFSIHRDGQKKLILMPQLKTEAMRDEDYSGEGSGMTKGELIYMFDGDQRNALISLLCADVLNSNITWDRVNETGKSMIVLHPQLNPNPKHATFAKLRNDIFEKNQRHIYISCNWAEETIVNSGENEAIRIKTAWSCIYYKLENTYDMNSWIQHSEQMRDQNYSKLLLKGFIPSKKVAIWYSLSIELVHEIIIEKVEADTPAVRAPKNKVHAKGLYLFNGESLSEKDDEKYSFDWCLKKLDIEVQQVLRSLKPQYRFLFECENKYEVDRFMEMCLAKQKDESFGIDESENLQCVSICVDKKQSQTIKNEMHNFMKLVNQLNKGNFPDHLKEYEVNHTLKYEKLNENESVNLISAKDNGIIVAMAKYEQDATKYLENLKSIHTLQENIIPYNICVYYEKFDGSGIDFLPKVKPDITSGNQVYESTTIMDGGE